MRQGICKLCLRKSILQDSHYMPRGMYKRLRDGNRKNSNPIVINRNRTVRTSKQATDYVLCEECEKKFNRNGEAWLMTSVAHGKRFPLLNRLQVAVPMEKLSEAVTYSGIATGIDTDKLGYFALSMVWRGAVHEWPLPLGGKSDKLDLGNMKEPIRQFLRGDKLFPHDAAVIVHICNDAASQQSMLLPSQCSSESTSFEMLTLGVHFFVYLGSTITARIRQLCCVTSNDRILFLRDCSNRMTLHFAGMAKTSKRAKDIESEWPD